MGGDMNIVDQLLGVTLLGSEWVLWLLLILSILSLAVMVERAWYFHKISIDFTSFSEGVSSALSENKKDQAMGICEGSLSFEAQVAKKGLALSDKGGAAMQETMDAIIIGQRQNLDRYLTFLGTLGNNAPFIGLFGTVIGIIQAFHDLAANPAGGPSVVMAGISEALVATAVGLMVAIPAVIAYNTFQRLIKRHVANAESISKVIASHYSQTKGS